VTAAGRVPSRSTASCTHLLHPGFSGPAHMTHEGTMLGGYAPSAHMAYGGSVMPAKRARLPPPQLRPVLASEHSAHQHHLYGPQPNQRSRRPRFAWGFSQMGVSPPALPAVESPGLPSTAPYQGPAALQATSRSATAASAASFMAAAPRPLEAPRRHWLKAAETVTAPGNSAAGYATAGHVPVGQRSSPLLTPEPWTADHGAAGVSTPTTTLQLGGILAVAELEASASLRTGAVGAVAVDVVAR
jgi:hypothetical protein